MKSFFQSRTGLFIVLSVFIILFMAIVSMVLGGQASPVTNAVQVLLSPFRNAAAAVTDRIESLQAYIGEVDEFREENEELRIRVAEMEERIRDAEKALDENERLRRLLALSEKRRDLTFVMAAVVSKDFTAWEASLMIAGGESEGIKPFDCVINEEGFVVGYISKVGANWAVVTALFDTDAEMGALLSRTREPAVAEGDFTLMSNGLLKLTFLPEGVPILNGDLVLTSGVGGVFPSELVIGEIVYVEPSPSGMGDYAVIKPSADLERLTQVFVVTGFDISD